MKKHNENIIIVGAGALGTSLANILTKNSRNNVIILARNHSIAKSINFLNRNLKYFPFVDLSPYIKATTDKQSLKKADFVFLAIPSNVVASFIKENQKLINPKSFVINLAKGLSDDGSTIVETIERILPNNPIISMKGPTFADELIRGFPSAFTVASVKFEFYQRVKEIFNNTNVIFDYTSDIYGVELLSVLKNIYAIVIGICDAFFNSANTRFLLLTKSFNEIKDLLKTMGGDESTIYKYCGFGDFTLTALNDLSRNRTLGLMIGKGFMKNDSKHSVILEGKRSVKIIFERVVVAKQLRFKFQILENLYFLLYNNLDVTEFVKNILNIENYENVCKKN